MFGMAPLPSSNLFTFKFQNLTWINIQKKNLIYFFRNLNLFFLSRKIVFEVFRSDSAPDSIIL